MAGQGHNSEAAHRFAKDHLKEAILETYMQALGMLADTPLGQAAIERATA